MACEKDWVDMLSALLTPVIGVSVTAISYFQWRTNEQKRKSDLYDKRCAVFFNLVHFLRTVAEQQNYSDEAQGYLVKAWVPFLFGKDIDSYFNQLYDALYQLKSRNEKDKQKSLKFLLGERNKIEERFRKYLQLD